jgi:flagellar hook-basal body complex protein FliE
MVASLANVTAAYNAFAKGGVAKPGMEARDAGGTSFASMVQSAVSDSVNTMKQGEAASVLGVAGKLDITQVVTAVSNAQLTLQTAVAVRDRVVSSYQEIMRMPI